MVETRDFTDEMRDPEPEVSEGPELIEESEEFSLIGLLETT